MTSGIPEGALEGAKTIFETTGYTGKRLALILDRVFKYHMGYSALEAGGISVYLTAAELGELLGLSAWQVNARLAKEGFQRLIDDEWEVLEPGAPYALLDADGLRWDSAVVDAIEEWA